MRKKKALRLTESPAVDGVAAVHEAAAGCDEDVSEHPTDEGGDE